MPSFVEFLKTGQLGELHCGMSKDEVHELLGQPEDVSVQRNPQIWKYGSLELTFHRSSEVKTPELGMIYLYFRSHATNLGGFREQVGWWPTSKATLVEFRDFLDKSGIRADGGVTSEPSQVLVLSSGVRVTFDEGRLHSACYTPRREPEFKQITISIPRSDLKAIQQEAATEGVSVSKLCSRWILERISSLLPS